MFASMVLYRPLYAVLISVTNSDQSLNAGQKVLAPLAVKFVTNAGHPCHKTDSHAVRQCTVLLYWTGAIYTIHLLLGFCTGVVLMHEYRKRVIMGECENSERLSQEHFICQKRGKSVG
jgi:hypothetical protein